MSTSEPNEKRGNGSQRVGEDLVLSADEKQKLTERFYTVNEIAEMWHFAPNTIRKLFENEPDVLAFGEPRARKVGRKYRRKYLTLRIPSSAYERVKQRLLNKRAPGTPGLGRDGSISAAGGGLMAEAS